MYNDKEKPDSAQDKPKEPQQKLSELLESLQKMTILADEYFGINSPGEANSHRNSIQH